MSMEHWPSLTATSTPKQFLVLGQNMTPLSDKHRAFLCKLSQFSKPESLQPQLQSWFCKDPITTLLLSPALADSGTASALSTSIYSNHPSNTFHSWQALLPQPFCPAVMLCRLAYCGNVSNWFWGGAEAQQMLQKSFCAVFLNKTKHICVHNPGKSEMSFSDSCEKAQAITEQAPSLRFPEGNVQSARTRGSFAAAKTSASLNFSATWLHS